ncbi:NAD(P)H-binding protein [Pseudomonas sp. GCM10022188]|uniref:NAD(P)H-binding protein n=1 Tax=Pseudomonas TaxID=286 RepID=UPI001E614E12|nr:NAD(P)H-binding protein [Pseudomonas oryzagri]MCC6073688.1 NAD(P)H-binding protein [Pseudomonas oryzagri]
MPHTNKPRNLLIYGASGLTGEHLLDRVLNEPTVQRVLAPTRRPLSAHPHLHNPRGNLLEILPQLEGPVDAAFCCLGSPITQDSNETAFVTIDRDLVIACAQRARDLGARHFLVVSSLGADPHSRVFYSRVKGEMEEALKAQDWPQLTIARPSVLLGERSQQRLLEQVASPMARLLLGKWRAISVCALARALWRLALEEGRGVRIVESDELRRLGR